MLVKMSRFGKFLACSKFPECKATKSLAVQKETGLICPRDGKTLNWKQSRRGGFMGCSGYPECKFALWKAEQMASKVAELTETEELPYKEPALKLAEEQVKQNPSPETKTQYRARSKSASPVKSKPKAKSVSKAKA